MRFYKRLDQIPDVKDYIVKLYHFLHANTDEFFGNKDNEATDMRDFEYWPTHPVDREHLVMYGELMLVDLETAVCDHAYVICKVTRGKHKLASGRVVHILPLFSVASIADFKSRGWRNGYFLLPIL